MRQYTLKWLFSAVALVALAPLVAQTAPHNEAANSVPLFQANARAVVVDVVVTQKNGEPIPSLKKENFKITENGKPQVVDFLEEHNAKALPLVVIPDLPKLPADVYSNVPPAPQSDAVNVLLLDSLNTPVPDQAYVHQQIKDFLKKMTPGTRTAIFLLGSRLRFVQGFTSDVSLLQAALNDKKNAPENSILLSRHANIGTNDLQMRYWMDGEHEVAEYQYGERMNMTFEALDDLALYLSGVPGRKNLVWFSSSFPVTIFPNYSQEQTMEEYLHVYPKQYKKTADLLTISKVAVYPIGAQGLMDNHAFDADHDLGHRRHSGSFGNRLLREGSDHAAQISAMEQLASDTGGKAYFNTNDLNAAAQHAIEDGSHYYTLSYTPTNAKLDGSYRKIAVQIVNAADKYTVSYRHGYNADDFTTIPAPPDTDPLRSLLNFGLPAATQLLYAVRVLPTVPQPDANATRAGKNAKLIGPTTRYSLDFMIHRSDVSFTQTADGLHHGKIQLGLLAYDHDGKALNWTGGTQLMEIKPETWDAIQKSGIPAHMEIDLPTTAQPNTDVLLRTGIYDWSSGKVGTLEIPLHVASPIAARQTPIP